MGEHINVMVQALWTQDGSLPQGLTVQNTYTELRKGSEERESSCGGMKQYHLPTNPLEKNSSCQGW